MCKICLKKLFKFEISRKKFKTKKIKLGCALFWVYAHKFFIIVVCVCNIVVGVFLILFFVYESVTFVVVFVSSCNKSIKSAAASQPKQVLST